MSTRGMSRSSWPSPGKVLATAPIFSEGFNLARPTRAGISKMPFIEFELLMLSVLTIEVSMVPGCCEATYCQRKFVGSRRVAKEALVRKYWFPMTEERFSHFGSSGFLRRLIGCG